jgi:hypothetical protein
LLAGLEHFRWASQVGDETDGDDEPEIGMRPRWRASRLALVGAAAQHPQWAERLSAASGLAVEPLDAFALLGLRTRDWLPEAVWSAAPAYATCLGLAIRPWVVED